VGSPNLLPSGGFATLSLKWMVRDLRAGWLQVHVRQLRAAVRLRGRYRLALAVGDLVPLALAVAARVPVFFVASAKTVRYRVPHRPNGVDVRLMRRAIEVCPRDEATASWLRARAVNARFVGNPMMDDLEPRHVLAGVRAADTVIAALPGSRADATANMLTIARVAAELGARLPVPSSACVLCAAVPGINAAALAGALLPSPRAEWQPGAIARQSPAQPDEPILSIVHRSGLRLQVWLDRFAEIVDRSVVVIGLAGTANEQAVGLGRPVVTFPTAGPLDASYVRMKMGLLEGAALAVEPDPRAAAEAVRDLLADPDRRARMAQAGRLLMGPPGASEAIATAVTARLREARC
jgi:uncharacterized protein (TIGR03492 family)